MKICVLGLGYIGLPTAAVVSAAGHRVIGVDTNSDVVDTINRGKIHITEPGLEDLVFDCVKSERLYATTDVQSADVFVIAVPTPFKSDEADETPRPDLTYVYQAVQQICTVLKSGDLIILESTSPVGTTRALSNYINQELARLNGPEYKVDYNIAYCPERVIPGKVLHEIRYNSRVIGGLTTEGSTCAKDFYETFVCGECSISSGPEVAEMVKLSENSFRDLNIAFANQLARVANEFDIDVWEVIEQANKHPRVDILSPGPGVGGHCIAVDPWFLINSARDHTRLSEMARIINDEQPDYVVSRVCSMAERYPNKKILCLGLSFKADVDDFRESPALQVAKCLKDLFGSRVILDDPFIDKVYNEKVPLAHSDIINSDDILVLLVDHTIYKEMSPRSKYIIDTRGCWKNV